MRLYNGCPDDELQAVWDSRAAAKTKAKQLGYGITYFPAEGQWQGYRLSDYMDPTPFLPSAEACLAHIEAKLREP